MEGWEVAWESGEQSGDCESTLNARVFPIQTELVQFIRETIRTRGPQPFSWFMEQALYHPAHGYYPSGRAAIGRRGDYFTNVSVGPLFGTLLAAQFIEIWERLAQPNRFIIVEQGAHDGQFAHDLLSGIRSRAPQVFEAIGYRIVEPFPLWQDRQRQTLCNFPEEVAWHNSLADLDAFAGIHFSNELLDALPVNLRDKSVGLDRDEFVFVENCNDRLPNESQLTWIETVAAKLQRGFVIAIDYGFVRNDFREVIQARARHQHLDSPFEQIGEADISVHVNWTDLAERAEASGLRVAGFSDQHHFFTGIASIWPDLLSSPLSNSTSLTNKAHSASDTAKTRRALQTLLHPEMLGRAFQVLALEKNAGFAEPLAGFRFARDSRSALGLKK